MLLQGNLTANPGPTDALPAAASLACVPGDGDPATCQGSTPGPRLRVWVSSALARHLNANPGAACGIDALVLNTTNASPAPPSISNAGLVNGSTAALDWRIIFAHMPHLRLVDSALSDLPLSPAGPLLQCRNCSYLTVNNLTLQGLTGRPAGSAPAAAASGGYGAVFALGLQGADVQGLWCTGVQFAWAWACMLLRYQAAPAPAPAPTSAPTPTSASSQPPPSTSGSVPPAPSASLRISGTSLEGNSVAGMGPAPPQGTSYTSVWAEGGFGALAVDGPGAMLGSLDVGDTTAVGNAGGSGAALALLSLALVGSPSLHPASCITSSRTPGVNVAAGPPGACFVPAMAHVD